MTMEDGFQMQENVGTPARAGHKNTQIYQCFWKMDTRSMDQKSDEAQIPTYWKWLTFF